MASREVVVRRDGDTVRFPKETILHIGDTVRYTSKDGKVKIRFKGKESPFEDAGGKPVLEVEGDTEVTVSRKGLFDCGCSIELVIGWVPDKPTEQLDAGGIHDVRD